jgi:hypothetical protein
MFGNSSSDGGLLVERIKKIHGLHYPAVLKHLDPKRSSPLKKYTQSEYVNIFLDVIVDQVMEKKNNSLMNAPAMAIPHCQ